MSEEFLEIIGLIALITLPIASITSCVMVHNFTKEYSHVIEESISSPCGCHNTFDTFDSERVEPSSTEPAGSVESRSRSSRSESSAGAESRFHNPHSESRSSEPERVKTCIFSNCR